MESENNNTNKEEPHRNSKSRVRCGSFMCLYYNLYTIGFDNTSLSEPSEKQSTVSFQAVGHSLSQFLSLTESIFLHALLHFHRIADNFEFQFSAYSPNFLTAALAHVNEPKYPITRFFISRAATLLSNASISGYKCML